MSYRGFGVALAILVFVVAFAGAAPGIVEGRSVPDRRGDVIGQYAPGRVLVKFRGRTAEGKKREIVSRLGITRDLIGPTTETIELKPEVTVESAVAFLRTLDDVAFAEPDYVGFLSHTPEDPDFARQWGLRNDGQEIGGSQGTPGADIAAVSAWDIEDDYEGQTVVAVIDSGINPWHPDLDERLWANPGEVPANGADDDDNGYVDDCYGYNWAGISQKSCRYFSNGEYKFMYRELGAGGDSAAYAQSIIGTGGTLDHVGIMLSSQNKPSFDVKVSVRNDLRGDDISSFSIAPGEVSSDPAEVYKELSQPLTLERGSTYYLVVEASGFDSDNHYLLYDYQMDLTGWFAYWDGFEHRWDGSEWILEDKADLYFRTNPNPCPVDDNSHGTAVSGVIAAEHNDEGIAGVSRRARIMSLKVADSSNVLVVSDLCSALYYAADNGARVINMSLICHQSLALQEAVDYAGRSGAVLFAAAGNDGAATIRYPAGCAGVLGVGATDNNDKRAAWSNINGSVDITAPGKDIYTTHSSGGYFFASGTSLASPHAAGVAAMVLSAKPDCTAEEVEQALQNGSEDLGAPGRDDEYGHGRVDASRALLHVVTRPNWYLAEGSTAWGFETRLTIENPNSTSTNALLSYLFAGGGEKSRVVSLPAMSQTTINPVDDIGHQDFSARVRCVEGKTIAVDRTMSWDSGPAGRRGEHSSIGVNNPAKSWYFPEGSSAWGFECWLTVQNPNRTEADCRITYMREGSPPISVSRRLPPASRSSFNIANDIDTGDTSIKVDSDLPVIPERSMYSHRPPPADDARREGHVSIGATGPAREQYLAEGSTAWGFTTYVLIQNPNASTARASLRFMSESGEFASEVVTVPAESRKTIRLNDLFPASDVATWITSDRQIVAERSMVWPSRETPDSGLALHGSVAVEKPHRLFFLPDGEVSARNGGVHTYTVVQNPNPSRVKVRISYLKAGGGRQEAFTDTLEGCSRKSYNMSERLSESRASVLVECLTSGMGVVVERSTYSGGYWAGANTIGGHSD